MTWHTPSQDPLRVTKLFIVQTDVTFAVCCSKMTSGIWNSMKYLLRQILSVLPHVHPNLPSSEPLSFPDGWDPGHWPNTSHRSKWLWTTPADPSMTTPASQQVDGHSFLAPPELLFEGAGEDIASGSAEILFPKNPTWKFHLTLGYDLT